MTRIGWGIMGCGWIGTEAIAPAIQWSANGRLVAVASRDREVAAAKERETGAVRAYAPYEAMLGDPEVDVVRASFCSRFDKPADHRWSRALGGGVLWDLTCYCVNAARYVTRAEPVRAVAFADSRTPEGVDASTQASLQLEGGVLASVTGSPLAGRDQALIVVGDEGTIEVVRPFLPGWDPTEVVLRRTGRVVEERRFEVGGANQFLHQVEHFASLALDPTRAAWPAEDGVRNVATCEAIEKAWRTGAAVAVDSISS